jgi:hypothetical protein
MRNFEIKVQLLKYKVLKEVAKHAYNGVLSEKMMQIPKDIMPGKTRTMAYTLI